MSESIKPLVEKFVARFDSQSKAAAAAGVSQPVVNEALKTGRVGPKLALGIETATSGDISRADLRPDIFGQPPAAASSEDVA